MLYCRSYHWKHKTLFPIRIVTFDSTPDFVGQTMWVCAYVSLYVRMCLCGFGSSSEREPYILAGNVSVSLLSRVGTYRADTRFFPTRAQHMFTYQRILLTAYETQICTLCLVYLPNLASDAIEFSDAIHSANYILTWSVIRPILENHCRTQS